MHEETTCGGPRVSKYPSKGGKPSGYSCPDGQWCIAYEAPNHDITSFDNILGAWLAIFQCISLEGWVDIMYWTQDAVSEWSSWYFVVMIIIGSFFAINLALALRARAKTEALLKAAEVHKFQDRKLSIFFILQSISMTIQGNALKIQ